jgi:hypothetical protein
MRNIFFVFVFFFLFSSSVFADEYWTETVPVHGKYVEIRETDFDYFSFQIPLGTKVEVLKNELWEQVEVDSEQDPYSTMSELISWTRNEPLILRFSENIPDLISFDFSQIDQDFFPTNVFASNAYGEDIPLFSRSDWGANDYWRYDGEVTKDDIEERTTGKSSSSGKGQCSSWKKKYPDEYDLDRIQKTEAGQHLIWPYQYSKNIRKIVLHHTAETGVEDGKTAVQVMRGIYRYHTVSRKWGDIGYHYVIAPDGSIFEGKAGGDFIVGGHAYCHNIGTIGVALMGNFDESEPRDAQMVALEKLLSHLAEKYELDLTDEEWYHGEKTPNLLGHRDVSATACPGENLYSLIPSLLRKLDGSESILFARGKKADGVLDSDISVLTLQSGEVRDISFSFKNTGNIPWSMDTWLFAQAGAGVQVRSVSSNRGYVAAKQKEKRVSPGGTAHFTVTIEAGYEGGVRTLSFVPVVRNKRIKNAEILQVIEIKEPDWDGKLKSVRYRPLQPVVGVPISLSVEVWNEGTTRWKKDVVSLEVLSPESQEKIYFPIKKTTPSGKVAVFSGVIPGFSSSGGKNIQMNLVQGKKKTFVSFRENISIKESENRSKILGFPSTFLLGEQNGSFQEHIQVRNIGDVEWSQKMLKLEIHSFGKKITFSPQEAVISPGNIATFRVDFPVRQGTYPIFLTLKDGRQRLEKKVLVLKQVRGDSSFEKVSQKSTEMQQEIEGHIIRIKLSFPEDFSFVDILGEGKYEIRNEKDQLILPGREGQTVRVNKVGRLLQVRKKMGKIFRAVPQSNGVLQIRNWERIPLWDTNRKWNDNRFFGTLEFRIEDDKLIVINELSLGQYLLGIGETIEADHPQKKKALALVARTYAAFYQNPKNRKFPSKPYDGSDDPAEFQKYLGVSLTERSPGWKEAVEHTKNEVVTYNGDIIKTPFHTCSGGKTISAKEKWGWKDVPYLISIDDPGCKGQERRGHGVGLSGGGAQYFAEKGWLYSEILEYFYPGTDIQRK